MDEVSLPRQQRVHLTCLEEDAAFADVIAATLDGAGILVTISICGDDIEPVEAQITKDVREAMALILLCTDRSLRDRRIRQHLHLAWRFDRPIIPILLRPLLIPDDAAYWLEGAQWIEAFDGSDSWRRALMLAMVGLGLEPAGVDATELHAVGRRTAVNLPRTRIPAPPSRLIGRAEDLAKLREMVSQHRLVTISGPGGSGKSRLAIELAQQVRPLFPDGVFFVELAAIEDADLVPETVARALRIDAFSAESMADAIVRGLAERRMLLVLDNFERVLAAAHFVADLLKNCAEVSVVITSRAPTEITGEIEFELGPLELPDASESAEALSLNESIQLFVERAHGANPLFALTPENAAEVARLCIALDGLPLSIELVAGKSRVLTPAEMLMRFAGSTDLLAIEGNVGGPDHQRSLRKTIEWSVNLLSPEHRRALRWMGVFAGGGSLEAVESILSDTGLVAKSEVLKVIESLVHQHLLVRVDQPNGESRFQMLESIRAYAKEALRKSGDDLNLERSHATFYLELLTAAEQGLAGPDQARWLRSLDADYENCRQSIEWALTTDPTLSMGALNGLWLYWTKHGGLHDGLDWIERLSADVIDRNPDVASRLLNIIGNVACDLSELDRAEQAFQRCRKLARMLDQPLRIASATVGLGIVSYDRGAFAAARRRLRNALDTATRHQDDQLAAVCLDTIGDTWAATGKFERAVPFYEGAMTLFSRLDELGGLAFSNWRMGTTAYRQGDFRRARRFAELSLDQFTMMVDPLGATYPQLLLGRVGLQMGNMGDGSRFLQEALKVRHRERLTMHIVEAIEVIVLSIATDTSGGPETQMLSLCNRIRRLASAPALPLDAKEIEIFLGGLRTVLAGDIFDASWNAGQLLDLDAGVQMAQDMLDTTRSQWDC